tara:strand:+ start:254 stop:550 length:297 start_codon:yes stop_codon:yes gene_type:complete
MYIFLTIFLIYVITFLVKKDSKLFGDYNYFNRNNIFGNYYFNNNSEYNSNDEELSDEELSDEELSDEELSNEELSDEDKLSVNSDDLVNSYDTLKNDL